MNSSNNSTVPFKEVLITCLKKYKILVFFGTFLVLLFTTLIALLWGAHLYDSDILRNGEKATGKIFSKKISLDEDGFNEYSIVYIFPAKVSGREGIFDTFGRHILNQEEWEPIKKDDSIEIAYDPNNPERNFPVESGGINSRFMVVIFTVFLGFFAGLGVLILYGFFFNLVIFTSKLLNNGVHTQGKITKIEQNGGMVIHYQFKDGNGKLHEGMSGQISDELAENWKVGQSGAICYDQLKPKKSLWYAEDWKKYLL